MFIFQKAIDRSLLRQGFQIPVEYHHLLKAMPGGSSVHGETRNITVIIDGQRFYAQLKNQGFGQVKYDGHPDVIQIRCSENSPIANHLRKVFFSTWEYAEMIKTLPENINRKSAMPEWGKENLSFHFPNGLAEKVKIDFHLKTAR